MSSGKPSGFSPSFLTSDQKRRLAHHIALCGTNYKRYLEFCEREQLRPYTAEYLRKWAKKYRQLIQSEREQHFLSIRAKSALDRSARLSILEDTAMKLNDEFQRALADGEREAALKLAEQLRKQLESIAKERGEYNNRDAAQDNYDIARVLIENMAKAALPQGEDYVDGEVSELEEAPVQPEEAGF